MGRAFITFSMDSISISLFLYLLRSLFRDLTVHEVESKLASKTIGDLNKRCKPNTTWACQKTRLTRNLEKAAQGDKTSSLHCKQALDNGAETCGKRVR